MTSLVAIHVFILMLQLQFRRLDNTVQWLDLIHNVYAIQFHSPLDAPCGYFLTTTVALLNANKLGVPSLTSVNTPLLASLMTRPLT